MEEERKSRRKNLLYYLDVKDAKTGKSIGRAIDISRGGFKLCSRNPISRSTTFRFRIDLPKAWHNEEPLILRARPVWSGRDVNPELYITGLKFARVSAGNQEKIDRLFSAASFPDSAQVNSETPDWTKRADTILDSIANYVEKAESILS